MKYLLLIALLSLLTACAAGPGTFGGHVCGGSGPADRSNLSLPGEC